MKNNKTLPIIVIAAVVVICSCIIGALIIIPKLIPQTPDHYGVFLKDGNSFQNMQVFEGKPSSETAPGIPTTTRSRPEFILWDPTINLRYLILRNMDNKEEIYFTTSPVKEGMLEVKPQSSLQPGFYCFIQGDPLSFFLNHWCFRVR